MALIPPEYFESVRREAASLWDQLEANPVLAAPWWQLFRQVLSPRHVLSEMLQNADDVGAPWARAEIVDGVFVFEHGGVDFDAESVQSLCRFGFSNKRRLHTIGFRGVGFKSLFSLGPWVEVHTPTLAIGFDQRRFTEPVWLGRGEGVEQVHTTIRVRIDHPDKLRQMEGEIERWTSSPIPLLFFASIDRLALQGEVVTKQADREGPVAGSQWVWITGRERQRVLHVVSGEEPFPGDALEEVRTERGEAGFELPPCAVHLVLGQAQDHRLYAVLPTEVVINVPFSCNAPFVQDPARTGIKAPPTSPTNAWLLRRLGRLAGEAMLGWIGNESMGIDGRAKAYALLPPPPDPAGWSTSQQASRAITEEFGRSVDRQHCLLTEEGLWVAAGACRALPEEIHEVWDLPTLVRLFGVAKPHLLARSVIPAHRERLKAWGWLEIVSPATIARRLASTPWPPRPQSYEQLLVLWDLLQSRVTQQDWSVYWHVKQWAIVPAYHSQQLQPSASLLVVGSRTPALTEADWAFLTARVNLVDLEWTRRLGEPAQLNTPMGRVGELARRLGLDQRVGLQQVVEAAAKAVFGQSDPGADGIRLSQILARADMTANQTFRFLCTDGNWRTPSEGLLNRSDPAALDLLPAGWASTRLVSDRYLDKLSEPEAQAWLRWAGSPEKSGLQAFPIPAKKTTDLYGRWRLEEFCIQRGGNRPPYYHYKLGQFRITDYDFDDALWAAWTEMAQADETLWARVLRHTLSSWSAERWLAVKSAEAHDCGYTYVHSLNHGELAAAWLHRLRQVRCLPDAYGRMHLPSALLRYTSDTAPLMGVEAFLAPEFDRPEYVTALELLRVRSQPADATKLVERIRTLAAVDHLPLTNLIALYQAVDRVSVRLPSEELAKVRQTFRQERLIRTEDGSWQTSDAVFQENTSDFPDTSTVLAATKDLLLWDRLEVPRQPSLEVALDWLKSLKTGARVPEGDRPRVRHTLRRAYKEVWEACGAWLDLSGRWTAVDDLHWKARTQEIGNSLLAPMRQQVADLSMLDEVGRSCPCFDVLHPLEPALEWRVARVGQTAEETSPGWIAALGSGIARAHGLRDGPRGDGVDVEAALTEDRITGARLSRARRLRVETLLVAPYLGGEPVGDERQQKAAWDGDILYAQGSPAAHYQTLVAEVSRPFRLRHARDAVAACIDREPAWIQAYMEEHFELGEHLPDSQHRENGDGTRNSGGPGGSPGGDNCEGGEQKGDESIEDPGERQEDTDEHNRGPRTHTPTLAERFRAHLSSGGCVYDQNGNLLVQAADGTTVHHSESLPTWIQEDGDGNQRRVFYLSADSLDSGIEIPAAVWRYFGTHSALCYLLLEEGHSYRAYDWTEIRHGIEQGSIESHASGYRLRIRREE